MILTVTANPTIDRVYFVEKFDMGEVHRPVKFTRSAGGKGLNVARVAKIMGADTSAMGFVGGYTGEFIKKDVEKNGIKNLFTQIEGETRTCVNISDKNGKSGEILEAGPEVNDKEAQTFLKEFKNVLNDYNIICVSGSLPKGLDSSFYIELVKAAKENNKKIIVDTSGKTLEDILVSKPYMVKPNKDELSALVGFEIKSYEEIKKALDFLSKKGIEVPFISLGKDGAAALIGGKYYKFSTPNIKVVNTVGSGDSTIAGITFGLDSGKDIVESIKLGMAAGTANTQFEQTGMVTKELVEEFYKQIYAEIM